MSQPLKTETDKVRPNPPVMLVGMFVFLIVMVLAGTIIF